MASTTGRRIVEVLTNKSGGSVIAGDVVVIDSANSESFTTTTTGAFTGTIGVAQESIANNAAGRVCMGGYVGLVNVNASVTRGNFGTTHTVAKQATDGGSSRVAGAFCQFLTGGTTPTAHLFGITDISAGALTDHTHAATGSGSNGGGATLSPTTLNASGKLALSSEITSTVDADQHNYAPTNIHARSIIRFTSFTANRTITGIDAPSGTEVLILVNNTAFSLLLPNESASSNAANRFRSPNAATHTVRQGGSALLVYAGGRWCIIAA